jgi:hypothetical protein
MDSTKGPDRDLEGLKERIRGQAAEMRNRAAAEVPLTVRGPDVWTFNWLEVKSRLKIAWGLSHLGEPPLLQRFRGVKRHIAQAASRVVLYFTRFITSRQTDFNVAVLDILRDMGESLHEVETRVVQQQEQIRLLEACLAQVQLRVGPSAHPRESERKAS